MSLHTITVSVLGGCSFLSLSPSVCSYYVAAVENYKAKAWDRICRRQLLLHHLSTSTQNLFVSTARIGSIGGTIFKFKIHFSTTLVVVCKRNKIGVVFESGPEPQLNDGDGCV